MSESYVNEATIALKGLLGIGPDSESAKAVKDERGMVNAIKNETSSNKPKNKKSSNNTGSSNKVAVNQSHRTQDSKTIKGSKGNHITNSAQETKAKGSKGNQSNNTVSDQKLKNKDVKPTANKPTENFAWSAFQSPPDPSSLPLPSFQSHDEDDGHKTPRDKIQVEECQHASEVKVNSPDAPSTVSVHLLNMPKVSLSDQPKNSNEADESLPIDEYKSTEDGSERSLKHDKHVHGNKTSQTGVNLAVLAMKGSETQRSILSPKQTEMPRPPPVELDPIAILLKGESYGVTNPALAHSQTTYTQHSQLLAQQHGYVRPYDTFAPFPFHPMYQPHPPPFTTIQVQVPPVLLPGNQMILPASPLTGGYPFPITLPEHAQPGMIVPITIPLASPPFPMNFMNMNMASPRHGYTTNQSTGNYYNQIPYNPNQNLHAYPYPIDHDGNSLAGSKSWAERVAEQSDSAETKTKPTK